MYYTKQSYEQPSVELVSIETKSLIASSPGNENVGKDEPLEPSSTQCYEALWDEELD